jgi:peptidyl-prolyl cis-trans isomerase B (cyclophilin B)
MPTDKQRREADRRRLRRQLQRRVERDARRKRFALIASIAGVAVIAAIVVTVVVATTNDSATPAAGKTNSTTATASTCTWTTTGNPAKPGITKPPADPPKTGLVNVIVQTSRGPMTFQLNRTATPCTVASFLSLAGQNYYNSTPCHRLVTSGIYVLQCGDPTGTGSGGPGYRFADELSGKERYTRGVLAMANSGADTNGSQFFIVYKDSPILGPKYTIFGKVTSGLDLVDKVAAKGTENGQSDGKPKLPISLTSINVVQ